MVDSQDHKDAKSVRTETQGTLTRKFEIKEAGPQSDKQVCEHWIHMWEECCGTAQLPLVPNHQQKTLDFISHARDFLEYRTFVAETSDGTLVGSVSCQVWAGPQPNVLEEHVSKIGTMWAVYVHPKFRRQGVAYALVGKCIEYWRSIGCTQAVLLYASDDGMRVYRRLGFAPGAMLAYDVSDRLVGRLDKEEKTEMMGFEILEEAQNSDLLQSDLYRRFLLASGFQPVDLHQNIVEDTLRFIRDGRERLKLAIFVARDSAGEPIASVCCQVWVGPFPSVLEDSALKFGSLWGLYVRPDLKKNDLVPALVQRSISHLKSIGCKKVLTLCPSDDIREILEAECGFQTSNAMVVDLDDNKKMHSPRTGALLPAGVTMEMVQELQGKISEQTSVSDRQLGWLLKANHNQLRMLDMSNSTKSAILNIQKKYNLWIDPEENWFTKNVTKLGKGFDLAKLSKNPDLLAAKFDKLAPKYEEWTLGNRSKVEDWIVKMGKTRLHQLPGRTGCILDICCGTGLMGQMLRLCGFEGALVGYDISQEMLNVADNRQCYDYLRTANANEAFPLSDGLADAVLCTGAMELLQVEHALAEFARLLKKEGHLWISFQQDISEKDSHSASPTAHQNVHGIQKDSMIAKLEQSGFEILDIEECPDAFYTPSPSLDGTLIPVPYFFVSCRKV